VFQCWTSAFSCLWGRLLIKLLNLSSSTLVAIIIRHYVIHVREFLEEHPQNSVGSPTIHDFLLELDGGNTSCQCCASCTGFQSRLELTLNWHVSSSPLWLVMHFRTCLTTYIWSRKSRKGRDVACVRPPTDRVLFHAHTTHSVTEVSLSRDLVSGIASRDTYAMRISPTAASGVNWKHIGFLATGAQCDILLNCAL